VQQGIGGGCREEVSGTDHSVWRCKGFGFLSKEREKIIDLRSLVHLSPAFMAYKNQSQIQSGCKIVAPQQSQALWTGWISWIWTFVCIFADWLISAMKNFVRKSLGILVSHTHPERERERQGCTPLWSNTTPTDFQNIIKLHTQKPKQKNRFSMF